MVNDKPDIVRLFAVFMVLVLAACDARNSRVQDTRDTSVDTAVDVLPHRAAPSAPSNLNATPNTALSIVSSANNVPQYSKAEALPGGDTTVSIKPFPRFDKVAANIPAIAKSDFYAGRALARQPWVKAPASTTARDGLGPIYNARACLACHVNGGKGNMPNDSASPLFSAFVRISVPRVDLTVNPELGTVPDPVYGDQLQTQSVSLAHQLRVKKTHANASTEPSPEAYVYVRWTTKTFVYPDGRRVMLRSPKPDIRNLGYGPLHPNIEMSIRVAPAIHGVGLLELIAQTDIDVLADPEDKNSDGISGRVNYVWDALSKQTVAGRFGHKASRPNLIMVTAAAFANDIGINNPLFTEQPCSKRQHTCIHQVSGENSDGVELPEDLLQLVANFNRHLGVPERRRPQHTKVMNGRTLFYQSGCATCHQPSFVTQKSKDYPHLSQQKIWPYSDLLLHDMGSGLADHRPDFDATGKEWRTPPLWGLGLSEKVNGSRSFLHDGRATSIEDAILWHAGEAATAQQYFVTLPLAKRQALIAFVESL